MTSSSNDGRSNGSKGIGFVLKLCHVIDWSWVWVLSPLWISAILTILLVIIYIILDVLINK